MDASCRTLAETEELEALIYDEDSVLNKMSSLSALIMRTAIDFYYNFEQEEMEAEIQSHKWTDKNIHQMYHFFLSHVYLAFANAVLR